MLDVVEIVFKLFPALGECCPVLISHLSPSGEPGPDDVPQVVVGDFFVEFLDEFGAFGSGSHKTHVTSEDVPELWDFIESCLAHKASETGHALVVFLSPHRSARFGTFVHRAKFKDRELTPSQSYSSLAVENRSGRRNTDQDSKNR